MNLMFLEEGETLLQKADELVSRGFEIADMAEIVSWLSTKPKEIAVADLCIACPLAIPREYVFSGGFKIVQVPAHTILKGTNYPNGWVDLGVGAHSSRGLAILVHEQGTYEI